jgi:glycosyltransferase involved in cell wall biosynthesis
MKLAVNARFRGRAITGVERYALEITQRLAQSIDYLSPTRPLHGLRGHWWEQAVLPWQFRGDLLWSPCNTGPLAVKRQAVTLHDCAFLDHPECFTRLFAAWYQWLLPRLVRRVACVLTVSEFSKQRIVERLKVPDDRVRVIPNGVNSAFQPAAPEQIEATRQRLQLPARYVLSVGSREPRKNLGRLLQAWEALAPQQPEVSLVIVGAKNTNTFREAGVPNDLPRVIQTGYLDHADLPLVYAGAELFVYPSLYEGFGLPVLEAMASGTAVVCSNTTALPEVAGNAASLVDPYDVNGLAQAMHDLLQNAAARTQLAAAGVARAKLFSWDHSASLTLSALESAALA